MAVGAADARARAAGGVVLDYETDPAGTDCPAAAAFRDEIVRQLGHDPFRDVAARRIVVELHARRTGVEGSVEWRTAQGEVRGERKFWSRNESCGQLAHAIALVTAIQIQLLEAADEGRAAETPPAPAPGEPGAAPPPSAPTAPAPTPPLAPAPAALPPRPAGATPAPAPREPWFTVDAGVGVLQDLGDAPAVVVPRLAVSVGRPRAFGVRLAAAGLGPGADVARPEGVAHLDRSFMTLEIVRSFRIGRSIEPSLGLGGSLAYAHVHGVSAMPSLAQAHDNHALSGGVAASAGLAFVFAAPLALAAEVQALLTRPSVTVQIGSGQAARLDGAAIVVNGGLLARF
jgi:hypothetical protein